MKIYRIQLLFLTLLFVGLQVMQSTDYEHLNSLFRQPLNQKVFSTANVPLRSGSTSAQSNDLHEIRIIFRVEKSIAKSEVLKKILSLLQSILQNIKTLQTLTIFFNNLNKYDYAVISLGTDREKSINKNKKSKENITLLEENENTNNQDTKDIIFKVEESIAKSDVLKKILSLLQSILQNIKTEVELNTFYNNLTEGQDFNFNLKVEESIAKSDVLKKILSLLQSILQNIKTEAELNTFYNNLKLLYQGMHKTVENINLLEAETPEEEEDTNDQDKIDINLKVQYSIVKLNSWNDIKLILQSILENINTEEELNIFYNNLKKLNFSLKELFAKQTRKAWEATKKLGSKVKDRVVARYKYIKENPANIFSAGLIVAGLGLHVYNQKKIMQTVRAQKKEYWRNVYNVYKEKYAMKELLMNLENMKTRLRM